jgi:glycosyltransferase involved in cell wall biosynthesis
MKILFCNKYNFAFSGTEAYLFETMELMRARGHEVALFSMADPRGDPTPYDQHFVPLIDFKQGRGVAKSRLALKAIYSIEARERIRRMLEEFRPDVAHVRNIYHHLSPSILWELKAQGIPVLYHMNDFKLVCPSYNMVSSSGEACERCKGGKFWNILAEGCYAGGLGASTVMAAEAYVHRYLGTYRKCVDLILAPSHFAKSKLIENGWRNERIQVLPHFQNLPSQTASHPGQSAPILYFGRLSQEKGLDDLIAAMALLPQIRLLIAGNGPQRSELETLARNRKLENVSFVGHLSGGALQDSIAKSQFTVFPSRAYETLGKSILESYAQGRAVVATDLGSRRELVQEGETGVLYRAKNVDQLVSAISFLHDRPDLSRQMGEAGREFVRKRHAQEEHFSALEGIYDQLAKKRRASTSPKLPQARLRIAFIGGRGMIGKYSGIETYYEETGQRLAAMGHDVTAYCRTHFTPQIREHHGIRAVRLPTIRSKHLDTFAHTLLSTVHACFGKYDIVHYHTLGPSLFSFFPRLFGKKTVVTVQGLDWQRKKWAWFARRVLKVGEWTSATLPSKTIVVSHCLEDYYGSRYSRKTVYVPNGTRVRKQHSSLHLKRLGLAPSQYVLYLGRFSPEKNCHLLIEAFERIERPFQLVLAGGSSHTDTYAASLRTHQNERIKILDWLSGEALEAVLTNATLFVLPSDLEGSSLALLDAMGAGVCVLASDTPENCEVIAGTGFTFRRGDAEDLRRMLNLLLSDSRLRETASKLGVERIRERYLWGKVVGDVSDIYRQLIRPPVINKSLTRMRPAGKAA